MLTTDYRPETFEEVLGQEKVIASLQSKLEEGPGKIPSAFLFHGPSGVGKTTIARILASELGCHPSELIEVDAATSSGVEGVRNLTSHQGFNSLVSKARVVILDECHSLSKQAWQALLKPIEDSPKNFYWIFCTTEVSKVPKTIRTRCHDYALHEVPPGMIRDLLEEVIEEEEYETPNSVLDIIVRASQGCPRQALSYLSLCKSAKTADDARDLLKTGYENAEVIELVRKLAWEKIDFSDAISIVNSFKDGINPESVRIIMVNYAAACLLKNPRKGTEKLLAILEEFETPFQESDKLAPLILALGRLLL